WPIAASPAGPTARSTGAARAAATAEAGLHDFGFAWNEAFALRLLARELACAADGFRPLARLFLGGLLIMTAKLHLAEHALALHLLLHRLEGLIDIVVTNQTLHASSSRKLILMSQSPRHGRNLARRLPETWREVHRNGAHLRICEPC